MLEFIIVIISAAVGSAGINTHMSHVFEACHAAFFLFWGTKLLNF